MTFEAIQCKALKPAKSHIVWHQFKATTTGWHGSIEYMCRIQQKSEAAVTCFNGHVEEMT
jgi:hypothetical protein